MKRRALVFRGPRQVSVVDEECGPIPAGHLLVRTRVSAISAGTELLAYRGELPEGLPLDDTLPALAGEAGWSYPFRYGYAAVGDVAAVGEGVAAGSWIGRRVFSFHPHASAFTVPAAQAWPVPDGIDGDAAALVANMETAVNLVLDAGPRLGERVAVFGQGVVGLLVTALLARFPLQKLVVVDGVAARAARGRALGAHAAVAPDGAGNVRAVIGGDGADLTFEVSGNPGALDGALAATAREGRVVIGSFYGRKKSTVDLGGHFHRGRISIVSSQVSHIGPALSARWDRARRRDAAWEALGRVDSAALVTHRFPIGRAAEAYALLDAGAAETDVLQILLTYE